MGCCNSTEPHHHEIGKPVKTVSMGRITPNPARSKEGDSVRRTLSDSQCRGLNGRISKSPSPKSLNSEGAKGQESMGLSTSERERLEEHLFLEESIRSIEELDNFPLEINDEHQVDRMLPKEAMGLLLPSCRAILCGSLMCQEAFEEVLNEMSKEEATILRDFARDFASRMSRRQRKRWEEVILGHPDPELMPKNGMPEEYGYGCRKEGLLQNDDTALKNFLAKEHSICLYLYTYLREEGPRNALIKANDIWCAKNGWLKGSCAEVQEARTMARLFKVLDWNLNKQYNAFGSFWEELPMNREDFLSDLEEVTKEDGAVLSELDSKILMVIQICKSSLARVPTNYDAEEVRMEYSHIVQVSMQSANEWVDQLGKKGQMSKYAEDVIGIMKSFVQAIEELSFELLVENAKSGKKPEGPGLYEVAPTVIPSSPYSSPTLKPRDPSLVASGHKGFESQKLRSLY